MKLILGSSSPRRLELLASIGIIPSKVFPPNISEESLNAIGSSAIEIAKNEGLDGHARSIEYRLSKK